MAVTEATFRAWPSFSQRVPSLSSLLAETRSGDSKPDESHCVEGTCSLHASVEQTCLPGLEHSPGRFSERERHFRALKKKIYLASLGLSFI